MKRWLVPFLMVAAMKLAYAQPFGYITNYGADNVSIIDFGGETTIGYVDNNGFAITNPVDVRFSPDGTKAYLLADFNNALFVIDPTTNRITAQMDASVHPFNAPQIIRFTPNGHKAYVTNEGGNTISIIDVASDTIKGYVKDPKKTLNCPIGIAFSPDGSLAFAVNYNANTISVIDVRSDSVTGIVDNGNFSLNLPCFINFIDHTKAYVTSLGSAQVAIVDVFSQSVIGLVNPGSFSFSLPFSLIATSNNVTEFLLDAGTVQTYTWPASTNTVATAERGYSAPRLMDISADNSTVYVTDLGNNTVKVVNVATNTITGLIDDTSFPFNVPFAISVRGAPF